MIVVILLWCIATGYGVYKAWRSNHHYKESIAAAESSGTNGERLAWRREAGHLGLLEVRLLGWSLGLKLVAGLLALSAQSWLFDEWGGPVRPIVVVLLLVVGATLTAAAIVIPANRRAAFIKGE